MTTALRASVADLGQRIMDGETRPCRKCGAAWHFSATQIKNHRGWCGPCKAAYAREWRKTNVNQRAREIRKAHERKLDPEKHAKSKARSLARKAIKMGRLVRRPCEVCDVTPAEAHHDDYTKPLDVRWLCPHHHRQHHLAEAARAA